MGVLGASCPLQMEMESKGKRLEGKGLELKGAEGEGLSWPVVRVPGASCPLRAQLPAAR